MADPRRTVLFLGGRTHENRGDLAMHEGLLRWLADHRPELRPVFLASNPETTAARLGIESRMSPDARLAQPWNRKTPHSTAQRVASFGRGLRFALSPGAFATDLRHAAAVVVPGSGSINSLWWHDWLHVKTWEALAARRRGVPVFASGQGVGPDFTHPLDKIAARLLFNSSAFTGVRDGAASRARLAACGVPASAIHHTGDDALLMPPDAEAARAHLPAMFDDRPVIALNLRDSSGYGRKYPKPDLRFWRELVTRLASHPSAPVFLFIPISYDEHDDDRRPATALMDDLAANGVARSRFLLPEQPLEAPVLRALAARSTVGIGISYHFLLFCLSAGAPAFGLWQNPYYRAKIDGLMDLHDLPENSLPLQDFDPADLAARVSAAISSENQARATLAMAMDRLAAESTASRRLMLDQLPAT